MVLAVLLAATGCSAGPASTDVTAPTSGSAIPSETDTSPVEATAPTGAESIFEARATLHPGTASGGKVPARVDVALANIGTVAGAMAGTVSLTDSTGRDYVAVAGHPDGQILDFGTLAPGAEVVRSYAISLPVGVRITAVVVDPGNGIPVDGPAVTAP